jgi:6-pyruvoyl-tetrahydropterin synthase
VKLFVDNLTNVDFSYLHPERGLLGESWLVQLELDGSLNEQGMVCDFGIVKKEVKNWFDRWIDHALVVPTGMSGLSHQTAGGYTSVEWLYADGQRFSCRSPDAAICLVDMIEVNELTLAHWCKDKLLELFPGEVQGLNIRFVPEKIESAFYHYSHGLQKHDGNCQRIAHGHRSKIELYINEQRQENLEFEWADRFRDIYIGSVSHLTSQSDLVHEYAYKAPQGDFSISLPARVCYLIDTDTTVELIASHLAKQIKLSYPKDRVMVKAYEGVGKGAIAVA